jgi:hypothetical protein
MTMTQILLELARKEQRGERGPLPLYIPAPPPPPLWEGETPIPEEGPCPFDVVGGVQ